MRFPKTRHHVTSMLFAGCPLNSKEELSPEDQYETGAGWLLLYIVFVFVFVFVHSIRRTIPRSPEVHQQSGAGRCCDPAQIHKHTAVCIECIEVHCFKYSLTMSLCLDHTDT